MTLQQAVLRLWRGVAVTALTVMQALGLMAVGHPVVPLGPLHMHHLQQWFISLHLDPKREQAPLGERSPISAEGPALLGVPTASVDRNTAGLSDLLHSGVHRCVPDGVGGHLSGESDRWCVAFRE